MRIIVTSITLLFASLEPVFAHALLDHASPRVGSTITQSPKEVALWFTEKIESAFSSIEVRNEQGAAVNAGKATTSGDGTELRVAVKAAPPGNYTVNWRVLSVDTHRTQGKFTFHVGH